MCTRNKCPVVIVSVLCCLLLTACGGTGSAASSRIKGPASQQVYRWAFQLPDIHSFDPGTATDGTSLQAIAMVFTGLVQLDDTLKIRPQLAQSYAVSTDGLTYTFHLRPNLMFSDGTKLDANDVAYSIDRALSPDVNNQSGLALTYMGQIKNAQERTIGKISSVIGTGILVPDAQTVVLKLSKATAYFLGALSYPTSFTVEKSVIEKGGSNWTDHLGDNGGQGGAGPFMVKTYSHTTGMVFIPNPHYYGKKPQLKEVDYVPYKDSETSYNAYMANQTDIAAIPLALYKQAKARRDFSENSALTIFYVGMNYRVKPFDNIAIRQAFANALSRDTVVKAAWHGAYKPTCHIVPEGMYGYNPHLSCPVGTTTKGDHARARTLFEQGLKEEGITRASFPQITLTYPSQSPEAANEATTEAQIWKNILGVTITLSTMSQNSLYTAQAQTWKHDGPLQMWLAGWSADFPDPEDWITLQFGENQPNNAYNFAYNASRTVAQQQALQREMSAADVMTDPQARAAAYNAIEQQLVDQVAWLPIYQRPDFRLLKPYVIGMKFNAAALIPPDDWADVYITQH